MKTSMLVAGVLSVLLAGCAGRGAAGAKAPGTVYTGQVWTWDENESTVTLRRGTEDLRLKVTPDQIRGLQLHQTATVRGEVAPPAEIPRFITPAIPVRAVPRGPVDQQVLSGVVTAVDPRGRLSIDSERGLIHVWAASGAEQRFQPGAKVHIDVSVQPVELVPVGTGGPTSDSAASTSAPSGQPGDYAVITGRIMGIGRNGMLVVESPTGPVQLWVSDSTKYRVEQPVQVRTLVSAAR